MCVLEIFNCNSDFLYPHMADRTFLFTPHPAHARLFALRHTAGRRQGEHGGPELAARSGSLIQEPQNRSCCSRGAVHRGHAHKSLQRIKSARAAEWSLTNPLQPLKRPVFVFSRSGVGYRLAWSTFKPNDSLDTLRTFNDVNPGSNCISEYLKW